MLCVVMLVCCLENGDLEWYLYHGTASYSLRFLDWCIWFASAVWAQMYSMMQHDPMEHRRTGLIVLEC